MQRANHIGLPGRLVAAHFYWRNDQPDGVGFGFAAHSGWSPNELEAVFSAESIGTYLRDSDAAHAEESIVETYFEQIRFAKGKSILLADAIIAALNIVWLTQRGYMPNDNFNGPMFIYQ